MITDSKNVYDGDYNPFEHRHAKKPNSDIRSLANLLKSSLGTGILAIPLAFANSGWALGIVATIVIAFICGHCVHIFVMTSRGCCKLERKPFLSYSATCKAAFANGPKALRPYATTASIFAEFSLFLSYVGVCCVFTVLIADSIKQLFDRYVTTTNISVEYYCLFILVPLSIMVQIRHLKWLAPFSLMANILLITTFAICLYYIFRTELTFSDKKMVGSFTRFPAYLSTVIFAIEGIGVVMPVENTMKNPKHFTRILTIAISTILILYTALGLFGYFRYGDVLRGSITLNLPIDDWPAICAKCFIALSLFLTYPLHFFVVLDIFTRHVEPRIEKKYKSVTQVVVRIACVWVCGGIGIALPMLEQIINIVGALFYSFLGLVIPGIIETVFRWEDLGKFNWILWKNILIVLFGMCCLLSGCTVTITDILEKLQNKTE